MHWFELKYDARCAGCGNHLPAGTHGAYADQQIIGRCCEDEPTMPNDNDDDWPEPHISAPVLPHGRTVADRCATCFQIPSSSGVCGCG